MLKNNKLILLIILSVIFLLINLLYPNFYESGLSLISKYSKTIGLPEPLSQKKFYEEYQTATVLQVNDGDTLTVKMNQEIEHIRLIGIDAPESYQNDRTNRESLRTGQSVNSIIKLGKSSTKYLRNIVSKGDKVYLEFDIDKRDRFNRLLAYVYLEDSTLLNEKIIIDGYALPYTVAPNLKYAEKFQKAHKKARQENNGLLHNAK